MRCQQHLIYAVEGFDNPLLRFTSDIAIVQGKRKNAIARTAIPAPIITTPNTNNLTGIAFFFDLRMVMVGI